MARKTKKQAERTRFNILDAAVRVFLRQGIWRTSLMVIAQEAGVSRGAIYWHFANKDDLLCTLWKEMLRENDLFLQGLDGKDESDPLGFLVEQLIFILKEPSSNTRRQRLLRLFINENVLPEHDDVFHFDWKSFKIDRIKKIKTLLCNAIDKGQLPPSFDVSLGAIAIVSYVDGLVPQYQSLIDELDIKIETPFLINGLMHLLRFGCIRQSFLKT
ncbi:MAG: TetR family transcriptional regulator [Desulforhopalus sp.]